MTAVGLRCPSQGVLMIPSALRMVVAVRTRTGALITVVLMVVEGRSLATMVATMAALDTLTNRDSRGIGEWPALSGNSGMALPKMAKGADQTEAADASKAEDKDPALVTSDPRIARMTRMKRASSVVALGTSIQTNVQQSTKNAEGAAEKAISIASVALLEGRGGQIDGERLVQRRAVPQTFQLMKFQTKQIEM